MDENRYPAPHSQVAAAIVDGQAVIVMADSGNMSVLNELGTRIWQLSDGSHRVEEIIQAIVSEYEVEEAQARADVSAFLEQLLALDALVLNETPQPTG
jgi:hypothetical protein